MESQWKCQSIIIIIIITFIGDHIRSDLTSFQHHMLVINVIDPCTKEVRVIHCANLGKIKAGKIMGLNNKVFEEGITITGIIECAMYKNDVSMVSVPEGISRARSRLF